VPKLGPQSCCPPVILEDPSEPFLTLDCAVRVGLFTRRFDQLVAPTLVVALRVVVLCVFPHGLAEMALTRRDDLIETLGSDGENESLLIERQRVTLYLPTELLQEARGCVVEMGYEGLEPSTLSRLFEMGVTRELERLRKKHTAGKPFKPYKAKLPGGRPSR
jgi:hypothetical protein